MAHDTAKGYTVVETYPDEMDLAELSSGVFGGLGAMDHDVATLESENMRLSQMLEAEQKQRKRLVTRYSELENRYATLTRFHVTAERLLSAQSRDEVLEGIKEVVANLIGSEQLGIFLFDSEDCNLSLVSSCGIEEEQFSSIPLGSSTIGRAALDGKIFVPPNTGNNTTRTADEPVLSACVPLRRQNRLLGVIAIFGLLDQRPKLELDDIELLEVLGKWASIALYCNAIEWSSTRKDKA